MNPELPKHETHKRIRSGKVKHVESMVGDTRTSAGIMGPIGGIIVKKNVAAGVMMIVAAAIILFPFRNLLSFILLLLGAYSL